MKPKSFLQKTSMVMGIVSEVISVVCLVLLILNAREFGMMDIASASYLACTFFFFTCGGVLIMIARTNLPSMNFDEFDQPEGAAANAASAAEK